MNLRKITMCLLATVMVFALTSTDIYAHGNGHGKDNGKGHGYDNGPGCGPGNGNGYGHNKDNDVNAPGSPSDTPDTTYMSGTSHDNNDNDPNTFWIKSNGHWVPCLTDWERATYPECSVTE